MECPMLVKEKYRESSIENIESRIKYGEKVYCFKSTIKTGPGV
jgi:hypothetical protein